MSDCFSIISALQCVIVRQNMLNYLHVLAEVFTKRFLIGLSHSNLKVHDNRAAVHLQASIYYLLEHQGKDGFVCFHLLVTHEGDSHLSVACQRHL